MTPLRSTFAAGAAFMFAAFAASAVHADTALLNVSYDPTRELYKAVNEAFGAPAEIYDRPQSPFVFSFIGESSTLRVTIDSGQVWLDHRCLNLAAGDLASGPALLVFRPHDVEVGNHLPGAIPAMVRGSRRHGGSRRLDLQVSGRRDTIEIELHADYSLGRSGRISVLPRNYRLYPASIQIPAS
jgi:sulfate transport system ATP-binding protein